MVEASSQGDRNRCMCEQGGVGIEQETIALEY